MLTLKQIIDESYTLVPNEVPTSEQLVWLNAVNQDFFNAVKIPKIYRFSTTMSEVYTLPSDVRQKNIDYVQMGVLKYRDLDENRIEPLQNAYSFDDVSKTLTLSPAPYQSGLQGIVRYYRIATTTFISSNLNAIPDAPEEFHWTYIPALASYLANTQDDSSNAANYENMYKNAWSVAVQNFSNGGST